MAESSRSRDEREIARTLRTVNEELHRVNLPAWLQLGLPAAQLKALITIARGDGHSITGLAADLGIGEPAASQVVEQLVRRGYAARMQDPGDRRRAVVTATVAGMELVSHLRQGRREHVHEWLGSLSDDDVRALARGLSALAEAATGSTGS
ncbi:MAG: MarR family transcriptional regulator [Coriobacteriia bacterium]|nr:MarR family transcriptional regulator [Coriobacteriia bacterium]